jgi:hypothetical protein
VVHSSRFKLPSQRRNRSLDSGDDQSKIVEHITQAFEQREQPVNAHTFLRRWHTFSKPVALRCDDGNEYVVKGQHAGRGIVNDHVVAHLGVALGAPVGVPRLVNIPLELKQFEPDLQDISDGLAHGTVLLPNCTDRQWLDHTNTAENRPRFALLAVLYGVVLGRGPPIDLRK